MLFSIKNLVVASLIAAAGSLTPLVSQAETTSTKNEVTVGCLYANSGLLSKQSLQLHDGLVFWSDQVNSKGGVYVKAYGKKVPVKLQCYDDQSSPQLVSTLVNRLISEKTTFIVADASSLLTAPAVTITRAHKRLLLDPVATSNKFFESGSPYIVELGSLNTAQWADVIAHFISSLGIKKVATIYSTNDFTGLQATQLKKLLTADGVTFTYDNGVPSNTSNYSVLINSAAATKPEALVELGYDANDLTFLRDLKASGARFNLVYTLFPLLVGSEFNGLGDALMYTYAYTMFPQLGIEDVNAGLGTKEFLDQYQKVMKSEASPFSAGGYLTGLVIEKALQDSNSLDDLALRQTIGALSGKLRTLAGPFIIDKNGMQTGYSAGISQFVPDGKGGVKANLVFPPSLAKAKAIYPAPQQ